jgi:NADH-quinone oxidoreductase subunit J
MILQAIFFYVFAALTVASAFMVISSRNPVYSVLFLILAFFSAAGLFVLLGAEFLAMILVVVYVGAVAVLFLFVVMMLDVDFVELRQGVLQYLPVGAAIGILLLIELIMVLGATVLSTGELAKVATPTPSGMANVTALGQVIYTKYAYVFEVSGLVLLVAMIGAIVLTMRHKVGVKRQDISVQVARTPATAIAVVKVKTGEGLAG